jgi:hypothetical protein
MPSVTSKYSPSPIVIVIAFASRVLAAEAQSDALLAKEEQRDAELRAAIRKAEALATDTREASEALQLAYLIITAHDTDSVKSGRLDLSESVAKATGALNTALKTNKDEAPALLLTKGILLKTAGNSHSAESAVRASLAARPTLNALLVLFEIAPRLSSGEVKKLSKRVRPTVSTDEERFTLLDASIHYGRAVSVEGGLSWAAAEDQSWYKQQLADRAERQRQAEEQRKVEEERRRLAAEQREREETQRRMREAEASRYIAERQREQEKARREAEAQRHQDLAQQYATCALIHGQMIDGKCVPRRRTQTDCTDYLGNVHCTSTEY